ncbi:NAD(P)H-dependent oxidoreductase [Marinicellulosiphila megalodicopiae]|uniref:NAD(P)H-dependent oxidoreductase n=1 Tax=Marinicellulosiphila megalodicopiae TaxID=2724896 RepID=UPI003BAEE79B
MPNSQPITLLINANPKSTSFCHAIIKTIHAQLILKDEVVHLYELNDLSFNVDLPEGYAKALTLEADLIRFTQSLQNASNIIIVTPVWWGGLPAKFKGLIDRVFVPGVAFRFEKNKSLPIQLLKGKTAQLIFTLDTPVFYFKFWQKAPAVNELEKTILNFCGVKVTKKIYFSPLVKSNAADRNKWLKKVGEIFK